MSRSVNGLSVDLDTPEIHHYLKLLISLYADDSIIWFSGVSSDLDGCPGALKREVFFHTFLCVLVRICNQTSSNQHLLVVGC